MTHDQLNRSQDWWFKKKEKELCLHVLANFALAFIKFTVKVSTQNSFGQDKVIFT